MVYGVPSGTDQPPGAIGAVKSNTPITSQSAAAAQASEPGAAKFSRPAVIHSPTPRNQVDAPDADPPEWPVERAAGPPKRITHG